MDVQEALVAALEAHAPLTALLGTPPDTRLYPIERAETVRQLPAVVYGRGGTHRYEDMCGAVGLENATFTLVCYAPTRADAVQVSHELKMAVHVSPLAASLDDERDDYDTETKTAIIELEITIEYAQA